MRLLNHYYHWIHRGFVSRTRYWLHVFIHKFSIQHVNEHMQFILSLTRLLTIPICHSWLRKSLKVAASISWYKRSRLSATVLYRHLSNSFWPSLLEMNLQCCKLEALLYLLLLPSVWHKIEAPNLATGKSTC